MLRGIRRFRRHDSSLPAASGLLFPGALYLLHAAIEHLFRLAFGVLRKQAAQQLSGLNGGFQYAAREKAATQRQTIRARTNNFHVNMRLIRK